MSLKTLEIREADTVTCAGIARDNAALLRTLGQLRGAPGVTELKVSQIRGKQAMQFAFEFHWQEGNKE